MSRFMNTVSVLGDEELCKRIIERTISEFSDDVVETIRRYAFNQCSALEKVDLPSVVSIAENSFNGCAALKDVSLPKCETIAQYGFAYCSSLERLVLPSLIELKGSVLSSCGKLSVLDFANLEKIAGTQYYNYRLKAVVLRSSDKVCSLTTSKPFDGAPIANGTGYIYVPRNLLSEYANATNWSAFSGQFRALQDYTVDGTIDGELDESKI